MKRNLLILTILLCGICVYAQPPRGQGGGPGMPPPRGDMRNHSGSNDNLQLERFPEIPNLTLKQREQVGSVLTKEQKTIINQMDKMHDLEHNKSQNPSVKEIEKYNRSKAKIDKKIKDTKDKSDSKIKRILTEDQYEIYLEKRKEFKFKESGKHRPMKHDRSNDQDSNSYRPTFPEDGQFDNYND